MTPKEFLMSRLTEEQGEAAESYHLQVVEV